MGIKKVGGAFSKAFRVAANRLEHRNNRRAAEVAVAIAEALDESDALTGLVKDIMDGIADDYQFRGGIERKERSTE